MTVSRLSAWAIGLVCGFELVVVATIGGAGVGSVLGLEGAIVAATMAFGIATLARRQFLRKRSGISADTL